MHRVSPYGRGWVHELKLAWVMKMKTNMFLSYSCSLQKCCFFFSCSLTKSTNCLLWAIWFICLFVFRPVVLSIFLAKPRSKSACGPRRAVASPVASNESHQRHPTVHFQLPPSPTASPQKPSASQSKRSNDPKIDHESTDASDATTVNNINNNNNNYANTRLSTQQQRKLFFMQTNPIQNSFNQNKPPSGKRSYTIINTELHTNEM